MYFLLLVMRWKEMGNVQIFGGPGLLSTSLAIVMRQNRTASMSYPIVKKCVLYSTNRTFPGAPKQSPGCAARGHRAWSRRRGGGDLARLRLVPESGYIHRGEAPPIDVFKHHCLPCFKTPFELGSHGVKSSPFKGRVTNSIFRS